MDLKMPDKSDIEVRPIAESDLKPLSEAMTPGMNRAYDHMARRYRGAISGHQEMLVALMDGTPIGSVCIGGSKADRYPDALYLYALDVGARFQNLGVGTALIAAIEEEARRRGLSKVNLEVGDGNHNARRLYERLGYAVCGKSEWDSWTAYREDGTEFVEGEMCAPMVKEVL